MWLRGNQSRFVCAVSCLWAWKCCHNNRPLCKICTTYFKDSMPQTLNISHTFENTAFGTAVNMTALFFHEEVCQHNILVSRRKATHTSPGNPVSFNQSDDKFKILCAICIRRSANGPLSLRLVPSKNIYRKDTDSHIVYSFIQKLHQRSKRTVIFIIFFSIYFYSITIEG